MRGMRAPVSMLKSVGERAADAKGKQQQQQNPVSPVGPEGQPGQTPTKLYRHGLTGYVPFPSSDFLFPMGYFGGGSSESPAQAHNTITGYQDHPRVGCQYEIWSLP